MTAKLIFSANWKMHLGPDGATEFMKLFLQRHRRHSDREVWFFPPAVSIGAVAAAIQDRPELKVGAQNIHWEPKGAFTGETSVEMAREAGADAALIGHSERRHVFGETDAETRRKVDAVLAGGLIPVLCVGEKLDEREGGHTLDVVHRQLDAIGSLDSSTLQKIVVAYEPVWAIGTGKTATPLDAAEVHTAIRSWFVERGVSRRDVRILYGGSVKPENTQALVSREEIDGVLVGGASLDPMSWAAITQTSFD
jgi:triosephosphate isomerase